MPETANLVNSNNCFEQNDLLKDCFQANKDLKCAKRHIILGSLITICGSVLIIIQTYLDIQQVSQFEVGFWVGVPSIVAGIMALLTSIYGTQVFLVLALFTDLAVVCTAIAGRIITVSVASPLKETIGFFCLLTIILELLHAGFACFDTCCHNEVIDDAHSEETFTAVPRRHVNVQQVYNFYELQNQEQRRIQANKNNPPPPYSPPLYPLNVELGSFQNGPSNNVSVFTSVLPSAMLPSNYSTTSDAYSGHRNLPMPSIPERISPIASTVAQKTWRSKSLSSGLNILATVSDTNSAMISNHVPLRRSSSNSVLATTSSFLEPKIIITKTH